MTNHPENAEMHANGLKYVNKLFRTNALVINLVTQGQM